MSTFNYGIFWFYAKLELEIEIKVGKKHPDLG